jgi:CheY-like chemotaxis protein
MALRVLLADESSTIKKVFQLALQDFAVEVRSVNIGVDVATVALSFKPDIIFADVLLQKKNGYEVALELKQNPSLKNVPVVLMWSGFMEFDDDKFQASLANASLEKPFDVAALRKLVNDLVPRTQSQRLSQFLSFPPMPELEDGPPPTLDAGGGEEFHQVPIPKMKGGAQADKFRLNLKPEEMDPNHVPVEYELPSEKIALDDVFKKPAPQKSQPAAATPAAAKRPAMPLPDDLPMEDEEDLIDEPPAATQVRSAAITAPAGGASLSEAQLEEIIRAQSAEVIESVVWKIVPDLAKQIIERELNKLLKERDSHP